MKNVTRMQDKTSGCASSPVIQLRDAGQKYLGGRKKSEGNVMIEGKSNAKNYAICYGAMRGRETDRVGSSLLSAKVASYLVPVAVEGLPPKQCRDSLPSLSVSLTM